MSTFEYCTVIRYVRISTASASKPRQLQFSSASTFPLFGRISLYHSLSFSTILCLYLSLSLSILSLRIYLSYLHICLSLFPSIHSSSILSLPSLPPPPPVQVAFPFLSSFVWLWTTLFLSHKNNYLVLDITNDNDTGN